MSSFTRGLKKLFGIKPSTHRDNQAEQQQSEIHRSTQQLSTTTAAIIDVHLEKWIYLLKLFDSGSVSLPGMALLC